MKNKKIIRLFTAALAVALCATAFAVPAFAGGGEDEPYYTETAEPEVTEPEVESGAQEETTGGYDPEALTPEGNLTLVDDIAGESSGDKQFITVVTKNGNYFYIIIDRAEDGENTVHFLNQVDEADLLALIEDGEQSEETPAVCVCAEKCQAGAVNTSCEICMVNMSGCAGTEPEPEPEPEPEAEKPGGMGALSLVLALVVLGGGAFAYIKFIRPKQASKASADPDDYDFADEEEYINEDEPEQPEDGPKESEDTL